MEIKWLGHASWMIKAGEIVVYMDPYEGEYTEKARIIVSSHSHQDHCKPEKVKGAITSDTVIIAPKDCAEKYGGSVTSLKPGDKLKVGHVEIEAVEAYNNKRFRSPGQPFHPKGLGVGYLVKIEGKTIYHTGDSDFIPEMKEIHGVDVMLVPSGGTYTMDNDEAAEAVLAVQPKIALPMHIWDTNPNILKMKVESASTVKVQILKPGDEIKI
jgi:L-ascorbate metabolism protein UlaG (beta-lactamase superfamily)